MTTRLAVKMKERRKRLMDAEGTMVEGGAEDAARRKELQDTESWLRAIRAKSKMKKHSATRRSSGRHSSGRRSSGRRSSGRHSSGRHSSGRRSSNRRMKSPIRAADGRVVAVVVGQPPRYVGGGRRPKRTMRCRCTRRRCNRRRCTRRCCPRRGRGCTRRARCC